MSTQTSPISIMCLYMSGCQNDGPFLGTLNIRCRIIIGYPERDHNFDNHPNMHSSIYLSMCLYGSIGFGVQAAGFRVEPEQLKAASPGLTLNGGLMVGSSTKMALNWGIELAGNYPVYSYIYIYIYIHTCAAGSRV